MPELIEVELYRTAGASLIGHRIDSVPVLDVLLAQPADPEEVRAVLVGRVPVAARRRGKLMMLDLDDGTVLGLRFGMTGRLLVGDLDPVGRLEYGANRDEPLWDRFVAEVDGVGTVRLNDPRRLARVIVDPNEAALGPDAATITLAQVRDALAGAHTALKARLLDQAKVAGLGNLLVDETLWRARLAPGRTAGELDAEELRVLARTIRSTVATLTRRGGSHTGDLQAFRAPGAHCPRCHEPLRREQWGGRTTYWCPHEQV